MNRNHSLQLSGLAATLARFCSRNSSRELCLALTVVCASAVNAHAVGCLSSGNTYQGADLHGLSCPGNVYSGGNNALRSANLSDAVLNGANLTVGDYGFYEATLPRAVLSGATVKGGTQSFLLADLSDAKLQNASFDIFGNSQFALAKFVGANLSGAKFNLTWTSSSALEGADFTNATAVGAQFVGESIGFFNAKLINADFSLTTITFDSSPFSYATLTNANFTGSRIETDGVNGFDGADLTGANFTNAYVNAGFVGLEGTNLTNTNFSGATVYSYSGFSDSNLTNANFAGATVATGLSGFSRTNITGANFAGADLTGAPVERATFSTANRPKYSLATKFATGFDPVARGWQLVPEPGSSALVVTALAALTSLLRRRSVAVYN